VTADAIQERDMERALLHSLIMLQDLTTVQSFVEIRPCANLMKQLQQKPCFSIAINKFRVGIDPMAVIISRSRNPNTNQQLRRAFFSNDGKEDGGSTSMCIHSSVVAPTLGAT
jgi:hypothetical protein